MEQDNEPAIPKKVNVWPLLLLYFVLSLGLLFWVTERAITNTQRLEDILAMRKDRFVADCQGDGKKLYECQYMWNMMKDKEMH